MQGRRFMHKPIGGHCCEQRLRGCDGQHEAGGMQAMGDWFCLSAVCLAACYLGVRGVLLGCERRSCRPLSGLDVLHGRLPLQCWQRTGTACACLAVGAISPCLWPVCTVWLLSLRLPCCTRVDAVCFVL